MLHTRIAPAGAALPGFPGGAIVDATNPPGRLAQFVRLVRGFDRKEVGIAVDYLIELLDAADGDLDLEEPGLEDSFVHFEADGPGCPIADSATDISWAEWTSRGRHKLEHEAEPIGRDQRHHSFRHEDDEDDDPAEQDDEPEDDDSDRCAAGDDQIIPGPAVARDQWMTWGPVGHSVGNEDDAEDERPPAYMIDQSRPLFLSPANDWWQA